MHGVAILDENTRIDTSVPSFEYECRVCKERRRYAVPESVDHEVLCLGKDFSVGKIPNFGLDQHYINLSKSLTLDEKYFLLYIGKYRGFYVKDITTIFPEIPKGNLMKELVSYKYDGAYVEITDLGLKIYTKLL